MPSILQASLVGGELAPALWGRTDFERYLLSLAICRNFVVQPYGGVQNRGGTVYCATVKGSGRARLIPFNYNIDQSSAMEFGAGYIRFHSYGAPVVLSAASIAGAGTYNATTIYPQGKLILSSGVMYYSVQAQNVGNALTNTAWWYPLTSFLDQFGVKQYLVEIPTPYSASEAWALNYVQSLDVVTLVHPNHPPMQLSRFAADTWTLTAFAFINGPWQAQNTDTTNTIYASASSGSVTLTSTKGIFNSSQVGQMLWLETCTFGNQWQPGVAVTAGWVLRSSGNYYLATNSGTTGTIIPSHLAGVMNDGASGTNVYWQYLDSGWGSVVITGVTNAYTATATVLSRLPSLLVGTPGTSYPITAVAAGTGGATQLTLTGSFPSLNGAGVLLSIPWTDTLGGSHVFNGGAMVTVVSSTVLLLTDLSALFTTLFPNFSAITGSPTCTLFTSSVTGLQDLVASTFSWAWGAWGGNQGYPSCVDYFQQRQVFAATPTQPQTVWMSKTGSYVDFGVSSPIVDSDAITFTIAAKKGNAIQQLVALSQLIILTNGSEFKVGQNPEDVITPSNISTSAQGFRGSNQLPGLQIQNGGLFVQGNNRTVRAMNYDFATNTFTGNDIMILASHLTDGYQVVDWAYQQDPLSCVWCVRSDGELLGLTYMPEQQIAGWHRHDTAGGAFESVCTVDENTEAAPYQNTPYFIVNRNGQRTIEYMAPRLITDVRDSVFVDCSMTYDGRTGYRGTPWNLTNATVTLSPGLIPFTASAAFLATGNGILTTVNLPGSAPWHIAHLTRNGTALVQGTDYTVNLTTGVVTLTATTNPISLGPLGTGNGIQATWALNTPNGSAPTSASIYKNGTLLTNGTDYTISGSTVTFTPVTNSIVAGVVGTGNGSQTLFSALAPNGTGWTSMSALYRQDWQGLQPLTTAARTNLLAYSTAFNNAAYTNTSTTVTTGIADPSGGTNACTLTAAAGSASIYQSITVPSGTYMNSVWIRRRTGTGAINLLEPNLSAWTGDIGITSGIWQRFTYSGPSNGTTTSWGVRLITLGDAIDVAFGQVEPGSSATPYIPTLANPVTTINGDYLLAGPGGLSRTNLCTYSGSIGGTSWVLNSGTFTLNAALAPDGTTTATLFNQTAYGDGWYKSLFTIGIAQVASVYFKYGSGSSRLLIGDNGVNQSTINTATLAIVNGGNAAGAVVAIGNGWYRFAVALTPSATLGTLYVGAGVIGTCYVWGFQVENGTTLTPYIPTTTSAVTVNQAANTVLMTTAPVAGAALTASYSYLGGPPVGAVLTWSGAYLGGLAIGSTLAWSGSYMATNPSPNWDNTDPSVIVTSSVPFFQGAQDIGSAIVFENAADGILYKLVLTSASGALGSPGSTATGILNKPLPAQYQNSAQSTWYLARNSFSGMAQLAGQTVSILADGSVAPQVTVSSSGTFSLPNPAFVITAGLPITAQLQTLPVVVMGMIDTNRDKWKLVNTVRVMINESRGLWAGPNFTNLLQTKSRSFENYDQPPNLITDLIPLYIQGSWVKFGQVCIQTTDPLPLSILSIIPDISQIGGT